MSTDKDAIATALSGYEVGGTIGQGESGTVWSGRHLQLHRQVAIKQLASAASPEQAARFRREARILAQLDHPHVVTVYDYREQGDLRLLVMAYLGGGTLADRRAAGLSTETAIAATLAAASGLHHVHQLGVLHRDIKPENLMFDGRGVLKVTDFGIARNDPVDATAMHLTHTGSFFGTPAYVSPEQAGAALAEGWPPVGEASDQYSLAAVLFEMLTGRLTHDPAGGAVALCTRRMNEPPASLRELLPALPGEVSAVAMRALERDPADRYPSVEAFGQALGAAARSTFGSGWLERSEVPLHDVGAIGAAATAGAGRRSTSPDPGADGEHGGPGASDDPGPPAEAQPGRTRRTVGVAAAVVLAIGLAAGAYLITKGSDPSDDAGATGTTTTTVATTDATAEAVAVSEAWRFPTAGQVYSSPVVDGDLVVVGSDDASVYGLDAETGAQRWSTPTEGPVKASPAIADGVAYVGSYDGYLYAIDTGTGAVRWKEQTGFEMVSSPTVADGAVIVGVKDHLASFDAETGAPRWSSPPTGGDIVSSPAIGEEVAIVGSSDHLVYAVSLADGTERWHVRTGDKVVSSPVISGSKAYVGGRDGYLYSIDVATGANDAVDLGSPIWSSPALDDTTVFVGTDGGKVEAVSLEDLSVLWSKTTGNQIESTPVIADDWLGVGSNDGSLHVFGTEDGTPSGTFATEGPVLSSPVAVEDGFIVGSYDGNIYRVRVDGMGDG